MNPYALSILLSSLAIGTVTTFVSNHWFLAWIGLELNTLAILPLITKMHHPRATEAATKYFLIQASASALILFSMTLNSWLTGHWMITSMIHHFPSMILTIALTMKLGIAPFHMWLPDVLQGSNLFTCLILSTWQKLAPMILLFQTSSQLNMHVLMMMAVMSTMIGGWGGLNQTQVRKIMAYSSIAHLGWMILVLTFLPNLMLLNLFIYLLMTSSMFLMLMTLSSTNMNKMALSWLKSPTLVSSMLIMLMSLGGLPPTSGFMPKWLILQEITKHNMNIMATMMAMSALLSLFFYLRMSYCISLTTAPNTLNSNIMWRFNTQPYFMMPMLIILATMLLPMTTLLNNWMI
uniref:NADH-ubiquinone oxidoreductase chain 2 n=1 Tax=Dicamptodon tenebrosus TaxID=94176 RepID=Q2TFA5_9SALA|nr:NADH dehydrogenase subunit 2 [Dicamptodon tenebrosus]ACO05462.1 NADH dehydrogenase subunit 2 [Dicamptodon tenebrosus]